MNQLRRFPPLVLAALGPLALSGSALADADLAPVQAAPAMTPTTEASEDAGADDTESDDSPSTTEDLAADPDESSDPAREDWLDFAADADSDSFAGGAQLADLVEGARVLMIGDSLMASTSSRYGGEMCETVTPEGWDVEVDAETGRFIDFGDDVLDDRLDENFDVVVIMLGNNYGANPDVFEEMLRDQVDRIDGRPTVLSTVTVFQPNRADVNDIIYDIAKDHDNVRVIDWAGETAENAALTGGDGLHLTDLGRARFADMVAAELGDAPARDGFDDGACLSSAFTDDSAGTTDTGPVEGQVTPPPTTQASNGGGQNTSPPVTAPPATTPTPTPTTGAPVTDPPATQPPPTEPPPTQPPPTQPPPTVPPPTVPPPTVPPPTGPPAED